MLTSLPAGLFSHARFSDDAMLGNQLLQLFTRSQNADLLHWIPFLALLLGFLYALRACSHARNCLSGGQIYADFTVYRFGLEDPSVRSVKAEKLFATGATPTVELKTPLEKLFWLLSQFL